MLADNSAIIDIKDLTVTFKSTEGVSVAVDNLNMQLMRCS